MTPATIEEHLAQGPFVLVMISAGGIPLWFRYGQMMTHIEEAEQFHSLPLARLQLALLATEESHAKNDWQVAKLYFSTKKDAE